MRSRWAQLQHLWASELSDRVLLRAHSSDHFTFETKMVKLKLIIFEHKYGYPYNILQNGICKFINNIIDATSLLAR